MSLNPTGIEWTHVFGEGSGYTWNPIVGCSNTCDYCYARRIATTRLAHLCEQCATFTPHIHEERLAQVTPRQRPKGIFVGSLCDMWDPGVPQEWRDRVWARMAECRQHVYFTLTKQPQNVEGHNALGDAYAGVTITSQSRADEWLKWSWQPNFVSFEPLLGPISMNDWGATWLPDWIIIGADSRPAGVAHTTEPEWVEHLAVEAQAAGVPVFAKDNLTRVMGAEWVRAHREWPAELEALQCPATETAPCRP